MNDKRLKDTSDYNVLDKKKLAIAVTYILR